LPLQPKELPFIALNDRGVETPQIEIRPLESRDVLVISDAFTAMGWNKPPSIYEAYHQEQLSGRRLTLTAHVRLGEAAEFAGYVTVLWGAEYPAFQEAGIPEIQDLNVVDRYRRRHVATALMDRAESVIAPRFRTAGLAVGLSQDYGPAQRLYVLRGYVPDGRGIASAHRHVQYKETIRIDEYTGLYMTKELTPKR
jgi:GNAT superfamily N-acetyltransferase